MAVRLSAFFISVIAVGALPAAAIAQEGVIEEIIVTGTGVERTEFETPQSVAQFNEEELRLFTAASQADILTQLPGISAEGGGGEVATNAFVRGLPSGGQFQFTPLLYDGIPAFTTFGLNSSAFDVYYRNDLGIERVEYVTGGVSNLFGPGSVAGIINYISKQGGDTPEGTLQVEAAEETRFRGDYYFSGPLGGPDTNTYYAVSGFYRYDEGTLDSGLETEGFQLRGNIRHDFADGSGSITIFGQAIDDRVQFFLPLPVDGVSRKRVSGNDGREVFTMNTVEATGLAYDTPGGRFETPIGDGVVTDGGAISAVLEKDLNADWTLNSKMKFARYDHQFNLFLDGDGVVNAPETLATFLTTRGLDAFAANAEYTYVQSGLPLASGDLLFGNRTLDRWRDATDFSFEASIGRNLSAWGGEHAITIGAFFSNTEADDINYITTYLGDFRSAPLLVDLTLNDVTQDGTGALVASPGDTFRYTANGLLNAGGMTANNNRSARRTAFYVADQIEFDRWAFDFGARVERMDGEVLQKNTASFVMGSDPTLNDDLETVSFTDGGLTSDTVDTTEWALSAGALYRLNDGINLFGNISRGFFFPEIRSQRFNDFGRFGTYEGEIILTIEAGAKFQYEQFDGYATFFWTELDDRLSVDFVNDPNNPGQVIDVVQQQSTEAYGIEAGGTLYVGDYWSFFGNVTLREHEFTEFQTNPALVGNELRRQPTVMVNTGVRFDYNNFDVAIFHNHHGDNFANDGNTIELDAYDLVRLEAGYTFRFDDDQRLRISANIFNLTDEEGITEGSPRQGNQQTSAGVFFTGRPILPQRITIKATYDF